MGSLTSCLKKVGKTIHADDKREILERSKVLRTGGATAKDAASAAVQEQLDKVRALLREAGDAATLEHDAAAAQQQPEKAEKPPERLTDAGEELIRNRRGKLKGLAWDDVSAMNDTLKVAQVVKANVWPRPDYAKMVEDGAPAWKVAALKSVYDKLAAAPVTRAAPTDSDLRTYIETMQAVREALGAELDRVAALPDGAELWKSIKSENVFGKVFPLPADARAVYGRPSPFDRSSEQGKENNRRALLIGGNNVVQALQFGYKTLGKIKDLLADGFPAKQEAWQKSWEVRATETRDNDVPEAERTGQPQQRFYVYEKGSRWWRLAKGGQDGGYATREQAEAFARSLTQKKREQLPPSRGLDLADVRRTGPDWRSGRNVTAQDIMDHFGFRGVNLGEYVKAKQTIAQAHLNNVFDAMSDLADLLGVPPKAMSLNGTLGVAIGAQGSGKALAHFVPGVNEINITRDSGAGALAHEFGHALDHYFAAQHGKAVSMAKRPYLSAAIEGMSDPGGVRPEVIEAMRHVMRTINTRPMTEAEAKKYMADQRELNQRRLDRWIKEFKGNKGADPAALDAVAEKLKRGDVGAPQDGDLETNLAELVRAAGFKPGNITAASAISTAYRLRDLADESRFLNRHIPQQPTDYARASDAMDAKKQGDGYWSTPWEKFARAFETFAIDALHDRERESLYLTGLVDSEAWRGWAAETGKSIPYPAGEERLAMQQALQKLVDAIETRETDHGVMMFSVTDTGPSKNGAARAAVERISRDGVRSADDLRDMLAVPGYSQWARSSIAGNLDTAAALRSELDAAFPGFDWRAPKLNEQGVVTFYSEWATVDKLRQLTEIADRFSAPLASRGELKPIAARDFGFQPYMGHQELASRPAAVLFGHLRPGAGITATTPLFTITDDPSADLRHSGIPNDAVEIHSARNTNALKAHPDYKAAKAGDAGAAVRVVTDLVSEASINEAAEKFGSGAIWAYPHAQEATGLNAIPAMLAARYARQTGGTVAAPIVQVNRAYHTGANAMERLISRPKFSGQVQDGGRYVLVDDVSTMGGTLAELANHIQQGGGQVVGVVTLANAGRAPTMPALKQQIKAIESRYGQALREDFHIDPSALTRDEAGYVLGFRDADELRNRAAKTKRERVERLRSKGVSAEGEDARLSAGWDSVDAGGSREETARYAADPDRNHLRIVDFAREQVAQRKPGFLLRAVVPSGNRPDLRAAAAVARGVAGHKIIFVRQDGERVFNGVAFGSVGHNYILLDVDSTRPVMAVVGHEILHRLRAARPDLYAKLNDRLSAVIKNESAYAKKLRDRYSELGLDQLSDDKIHEELLADIFGDEWNDPEFWRELGKDKPTGFKAVVDSVAKFLDDLVSKIIKLRPFGTEQYLSDLKAARDAVLEATREYMLAVPGYSQWARSALAGDLDASAALRRELDAAFPGADWRRPKLNEQGVVTFYSDWASVDNLRRLTEIADRFGAPLASRGDLKPVAAREFGFERYMGHQELAGRDNIVLFGHIRPGSGITSTTPLFSITDEAPPPARLRPSSAPLDRVLSIPGGLVARLTSPTYDWLLKTLDNAGREWIGRPYLYAKAGLAADYGLGPDYKAARSDMQTGIRKGTREAATVIEQLATLTREESRIAHLWMQEKPDTATEQALMAALPESSRETLRQLKDRIDQMGRQAVELGLLSSETYERNAMAYLHRTYRKYELEDPSQRAVRSRSVRILGNQFKGRGLRDDAGPTKIATPDWWRTRQEAGKADTSLKGEKFYRLEKRGLPDAETPDMFGGRDARLGRLESVLYWPASEPIPPHLADWRNDGQWEARFFDKAGKVGMWRDFTLEERTAMGEIQEVRYSAAKTMLQATRDLETARLLDWVARNRSELTEDQLPEGAELVKASEWLTRPYLDTEWVQVPTASIPGTAGVKRYGNLAGRFIPGPIWNDLRQVVSLSDQGDLMEAYDKLLRVWKISKTALSPATHTNNVLSNFILADAHDIQARHIARAMRAWLYHKDRPSLRVKADPEAAKLVEAYQDNGGDGGKFNEGELREDVMQELLDQLEADVNDQDTATALLSASQVLDLIRAKEFRQAFAAIGATKTAGAMVGPAKALIKLYGREDELFRLAAFIKARDDGLSDHDAGLFARTSFLDYNINAPWIAALRKTAFPFVAFTYRAVPMLLRIAAEKPHKFAKYALVAGALNALAYGMLGGGGDEDKERALLPDEKAGRIWGIFPKLVRMPWNDENGSPVFLDVRRWIPAGDVIDTNSNHSAVPVPAPLVPGGPLVILAEIMLNRQSFTGKEITKETDTLAEKWGKFGDYLWKSAAPNLPGLPGTYSTTALANAATGKTDVFGREQNLGQAALSSIGVKIASYPEDVAKRNMGIEARSQIFEIRRGLRADARMLARKGITQEEYEDRVRAAQAKIEEIVRKLNEKLGAAKGEPATAP